MMISSRMSKNCSRSSSVLKVSFLASLCTILIRRGSRWFSKVKLSFCEMERIWL